MTEPGPRLPPPVPSEVERIDRAVPVQVFGGHPATGAGRNTDPSDGARWTSPHPAARAAGRAAAASAVPLLAFLFSRSRRFCIHRRRVSGSHPYVYAHSHRGACLRSPIAQLRTRNSRQQRELCRQPWVRRAAWWVRDRRAAEAGADPSTPASKEKRSPLKTPSCHEETRAAFATADAQRGRAHRRCGPCAGVRGRRPRADGPRLVHP